ncbi:hypothetical protein WA026_004832 [Henosepilachna vigintioctopunctata]|uniref:Uncharacterized protein n=1 Tax=Henosepilachna vigintioctopunctata TaxID=420089 RepID=A0AAW1UV77_9CUCU
MYEYFRWVTHEALPGKKRVPTGALLISNEFDHQTVGSPRNRARSQSKEAIVKNKEKEAIGSDEVVRRSTRCHFKEATVILNSPGLDGRSSPKYLVPEVSPKKPLVNEEHRARILKDFNLLPSKDEQNLYLCGLISVLEIQRRRPRKEESEAKLHTANYAYRVRLVDEMQHLDVQVCASAFISIHGITRQRMCTIKKSLVTTSKALIDMRADLNACEGCGRKETQSFVSRRHGGLRGGQELRISHGDHLLFNPSYTCVHFFFAVSHFLDWFLKDSGIIVFSVGENAENLLEKQRGYLKELVPRNICCVLQIEGFCGTLRTFFFDCTIGLISNGQWHHFVFRRGKRRKPSRKTTSLAKKGKRGNETFGRHRKLPNLPHVYLQDYHHTTSFCSLRIDLTFSLPRSPKSMDGNLKSSALHAS